MDGFSFDGGTQFDFTYAPGTSAEQIVGFEMAGQIWSSYLDDDVTVRIHVETTNELPEDVIGAALPGKKEKEDYKKVKKSLTEDAISSDDTQALLNLPSSDKEFSVVVGDRELNKTKEFKITNANAKALDLLGDDHSKLDGYILVSDLSGQSTTGWDYDALRSGGNGGGQLDFLSVAMHEVGHVLGFVSGIDDDGWLEVLTKAQQEEEELDDKDFKFATPLDLFRYSDNDMAQGKIDLSTGGDPYFSLDSGATNLANFASGAYTDFGGDGYQASHWKDGSGVGIMNPILRAGEKKDISSLDLKAMDVIGWDISSSSLSWQEMYDNAVQESQTAPIQDRTKDVEKMIKESEYEARPSKGSSSNRSWQFGFWQFTTLDDIASSEIPELVESVPETDTAGTNSTSSQTDDTPEQEIVSSDGQPEEIEPTILQPSDTSELEDDIVSEIPELVESVPETDTAGTNSTSSQTDDTPEQEIISNDGQPEEIEPTIVPPSANSGLEDDVASAEIPELVESALETDTAGTNSTSLQTDDTPEQEIISSDEQPEEIEPTILQPSDTSGLEAASGDEQQQDPLLSGGITNEAESLASIGF